jgi:mutator protein MutT
MAKSGQLRRGIDYIGVGVGALILNESGEVLLLLRKRPPEANCWTIPGGAVEWFETREEALRRECREEVGIDVVIRGFLTVVDHIVATDHSHWVSCEYLAAIVAGEPAAQDIAEVEQVRWFPLNALPDRITQPTREAIESFRQAQFAKGNLAEGERGGDQGRNAAGGDRALS